MSPPEPSLAPRDGVRDRAAMVALGLAALTCAVPPLLPVHVLPLTSFYEEWLAAALGTATCAATLFATRRRALPVPLTAVPLLGLAVVLALQMAVVDLAYAQQASLAMLYVLLAVALAWCGLQLREAAGLDRTSVALAAAILASATLNAGAALAQSYFPASTLASFVLPLDGPRAFGNLGQANLFAGQLALGAASLAFLYGRGTLALAPAFTIALVLATGMVLSGSRSVWLYAICLLGWTALAWRRTHAKPFAAIALLLTALAVVVTAFSLVLPAPEIFAKQRSPTGLERLAEMTIEAGRGTGEGLRRYYWQQAWAMFTDAPLLGVGIGQYGWHFLIGAPELGGIAAPGPERNAHNAVLHLLAETGLTGAICVLVAALLWAWRAWRAPMSLAHWWVVGVVSVVVLHSLVEYPLWYAHVLAPFALLVGLGDTPAGIVRRPTLLRLAVAAGCVVGGGILASTLQGFGELRRWIYLVPEAALADPTVVARQRETAARLSPTLLGPYVDLPFSAAIRVESIQLDEKIAFNGRVARFAPIAPVVFRQIVLLSLAGRDPEAARLLDGAAVVFPNDLDRFAADLDRLAAAGLPVEALVEALRKKAKVASRQPPRIVPGQGKD